MSAPTLASFDRALTAFAEEIGAEGPVAVEGGRTRWDLGGPPAPGTRLVRAPTGIVTYRPEEMTVTVRAGTPVAELRDALAEAGQRSALPARGGTVGGAVVVGESDVAALGVGLVRASVLQVRYVSAEGRVVSSGGPTVKNVSGFDLPRVIVGSLGTLGLVGEVILRTNPVPARSQWLRTDGADPRAAFDAVVAPSAVLWDGTTTWVLLEGHAPDVAAETVALRSVGPFTETEGPPELPPYRWSVTPAEAAAFGAAQAGRFVACIGLGLVFASEPQPTRTVSAAVAEVSRRLKANFDPSARLNPGRVVGGAA